ncbi:MAG: hypothetical protein HPY66_1720 [Firmicutes bacterium]|nr:hypothetical protein [Bacillota bacterium]
MDNSIEIKLSVLYRRLAEVKGVIDTLEGASEILHREADRIWEEIGELQLRELAEKTEGSKVRDVVWQVFRPIR